MSKGNRNREKRRNPWNEQATTHNVCNIGFHLPDTPDNRELVAMLTGTNAARFVDGRGNLDSETPFEQKNNGDCEAVKLQSPPIL